MRGTAKIALKAGAIVDKYKMAKHFTLTITDADFSFARKQDARLDSICVVRTNLTASSLEDSATVRAYKSLAQVERAIRGIKTVDLHIRPIFHWTTPRVRAHVSVCACSPITSSGICANASPRYDTDKATAEALRTSVVAKAQRSPSAIAKQTHGTTPDGFPVHSLQTLLADLATLARNTVTTTLDPAHEFVVHTPDQTPERLSTSSPSTPLLVPSSSRA